MKKSVVLSLVSLVFSLWSLVVYSQSSVDLGEIVVTSSRSGQTVNSVPASVSVITADDIEKSNAQTVKDVLQSQTGIVVRDYFGNGSRAAVDIRGFGEFASQNTLVLVDGRRVNEIDLSSVDWMQIPLDRVEKIEIIRGTGSVLYGDNAVGGVINIVTKKGEGKPTVSFKSQGGSYQTNKDSITFSGSLDKLSYAADYVYNTTKGYRHNSAYEGSNFGGKVGYVFTDVVSSQLSFGYRHADYGLPGAIREAQFKNYTRKNTLFPDDKIAEQEVYVDTGFKVDFSDYGILETMVSFREKRIDENMYSSQSVIGKRIDTIGFRPSYTLESNIGEHKNTLVAGVDCYGTNSIIDDYSYSGASFYSGAKTRETDIDKSSLGWYLKDTLTFLEKISVTGGYRHEKAKYTFDSTPQAGPWTADPGWSNVSVDDGLRISEDAIDGGIKYAFTKDSSAYFQYTKGFRTPATDEYYSLWAASPVNTTLRSQSHTTYEVGGEVRLFDKATFALSLFRMGIDNELYYDPATFSNGNYDKTKRRGLEWSLKYDIIDSLKLVCNHTYTRAQFDGGSYNNNFIPLVPAHKGYVGLDYQMKSGFGVNTGMTYVGDRYFINDQANSYSRLSSYATWDMKVYYKKDGKGLFIGVNNITNQRYSEYGAISTTANDRGYYPSPERNFVAGGSVEF